MTNEHLAALSDAATQAALFSDELTEAWQAYTNALVRLHRANQIAVIGPDAVERAARALCIADGLDPEHDLAGPDERYAPEWHQFRDLATAAIAALTGRV
jgi:hypothetical protein